jgi:hypothetical protein
MEDFSFLQSIQTTSADQAGSYLIRISSFFLENKAAAT